MPDLLIATGIGVPSLCRKVADKQVIYFQLSRTSSKYTNGWVTFVLKLNETDIYICLLSTEGEKGIYLLASQK